MTDIMKITKRTGRAVPYRKDDVDTDRIIPARFMKEVTFDNMGNYFFYDERFDDAGAKKNIELNDAKYAGAIILVSGFNFGCGSSREHAPQSIKRFGINTIIAGSYAEIFAGNCAALGIVTVTASAENLETLNAQIAADPKTEFTVDLETKTVSWGAVSLPVDMREATRQAFIRGTWNALALLKANGAAVDAATKKIPYLA